MAVGRLRRLWFSVKNPLTRLRFMAGKASFVEADVEMTTNSVAEMYESPGRPAGQRLLAHYRLATGAPVGGRLGWEALARHQLAPRAKRTVSLACAYCRHLYVVQVSTRLDPLAARPASYSSAWFGFMHEDFEGRPKLSCPRCEQNGEPDFVHWESA